MAEKSMKKSQKYFEIVLKFNDPNG